MILFRSSLKARVKVRKVILHAHRLKIFIFGCIDAR